MPQSYSPRISKFFINTYIQTIHTERVSHGRMNISGRSFLARGLKILGEERAAILSGDISAAP